MCGKNLGLADLMGLIKLFFERMGLHDIRFKPAYNPYTEPSMEIFYAHPDPKVFMRPFLQQACYISVLHG